MLIGVRLILWLAEATPHGRAHSDQTCLAGFLFGCRVAGVAAVRLSGKLLFDFVVNYPVGIGSVNRGIDRGIRLIGIRAATMYVASLAGAICNEIGRDGYTSAA